ncbi:MAG: D-sedoheptulose 7-phosphate isomerase [Magnetococcales bacterium]|nr:D-sedoheptulose 7-phosphate isomerase [Magnetococcales bacterium]
MNEIKTTLIDPFLLSQIEQSLAVKQQILADDALLRDIQGAADLALACYRSGGKLLIAGNGGSAADAQHIAGELVSRFFFDRPALAAIALTTDSSILTAIGNDYGYERIFSRQIEGNGQPGDLFLAISTSGNSANILRGIEMARQKSLSVIGLTGATGGQMVDQCDLCLTVPSTVTPRIQEAHILIGHLLCAYIEKGFFPSRS